MRSSNSGAIESRRGSNVSCAAIPMEIPQLLLPSFESELQLSSALHVSDLSLASCEAEYHLPKLYQAPALRLENSHVPFAPNIPSSMGPNDDQLKQFAACLATPAESAEPEERESEQLRQLVRNVRSQSSLFSSSGFQIMEDPIVAYQKSSARWEEWLRRLRRKKREDLLKRLFKVGLIKPFSWESSESI